MFEHKLSVVSGLRSTITVLTCGRVLAEGDYAEVAPNPNLWEWNGGVQGTRLSGGEQQMLAIARILRAGARLLLLDEPTERLAPVIVRQIGRTIRAIKERGLTVLLVEQNLRFAATVANRYYLMEHGRVVDMIPQATPAGSMPKRNRYLGV